MTTFLLDGTQVTSNAQKSPPLRIRDIWYPQNKMRRISRFTKEARPLNPNNSAPLRNYFLHRFLDKLQTSFHIPR